MTMNRLSQATSPYLRQHASNPVAWQSWNEESLALAKSENKPIFLSIGYSTCHWCHVMAHESFENEKIAEIMNRHFINIKVDREERPDVDAIYMTAVQALTGSGGWPMSVWLTPDLKPFFAGTYFPPEDKHGRPGFPSVLTQLADIWNNDRARILQSADQITEMLGQYASPKNSAQETMLDPAATAEAVFSAISRMFDPNDGGFGGAPKFPMPVYMEFLLDYFDRTKNARALEMTSFTMEKIAQGGIYDQLGGGFARYSTDARWIVPHFEKMLYDNAQLISIVARLHKITGLDRWKRLKDHAVSYVLRDLVHEKGGFFSAEDADSEGKEGAFYLWTVHDVKKHLSAEEADAFISFYGLTIEGNFLDPHTHETGQNVLVQKNVPRGAVLEEAERKLLAVRNRRQRPHRDEKILTEWNGLMISALIAAGYPAQALSAARFLKTNLYDVSEKRLFRSWCAGDRTILAQQSDYALLIQALLDVFEATGSGEWKDWAIELWSAHEKLFFDEELGGYFMNVARPDLLIRMKDDNDNVIPSGNSIAVRNGRRLAKITGTPAFRENADKTVRALSSRLKSQPLSLVAMVSAIANS